MRHHEIFGSLKGLPLNSFEIYGMGSRCPKKRWKTQFLKVLFDVFSCKTLVWKRDISIIFNWNQHNLKFEHCRFHAKWCKMHIFKRYTCKINLQFRAFYSIFLGSLKLWSVTGWGHAAPKNDEKRNFWRFCFMCFLAKHWFENVIFQ